MASMGSIPLLILVVLFFGLISHNGVEGAGRSISTSTSTNMQQVDEDLEIERQLRILNKPPVKTIKTEEGDIFDCVDIHKQPAFDHPLLKDHKIQMRPSSSSPSTAKRTSNVLKRFNCPEGTVPIRRTSKEDLIREKSFLLSDATIHPLSADFPGQHIAVRRSIADLPEKYFYAASGVLNVFNPSVKKDEHSSAQLWAQNAEENIQAGWAVSPRLYGDNHTRLTTYYSLDAKKKGCHNLRCPGFVQVNKDFATGTVVTLQDLKITLLQEEKTGDWWLKAGPDEIDIGYYPKSLFQSLSWGAKRVAWGGLVKGVSNGPTPPMGNGYFPENELAARITNMGIQHWSRIWKFDEEEFESYDDATNCYRIKYHGFSGNKGIAMSYGGPGEPNCGV